MSALAAYGRLVWRPRTALQLYLVLCMVLALCMWVGWLHGLWGEEQASIALRRLRLLLIVLPFCLGVAAASPIQELLHAQIAWHLPRLRRRMELALGSIALLCAAGTVTGLELLGWLAVPVLPALALALLAFTMGLLAFDRMHPRKAPGRVSLALTAALLLFSESLWSAMRSWPVMATLIGTGGAAWLLHQCLSREALRHKGLVRVQRVMGLDLTVSPSLDDIPEPEARAPARPPALEPRGDRSWMWMRAAHYEVFGWSAKGWIWPLGLLLAVIPIMICVYTFVDAYLSTGSAREGLEFLHGALMDSGGGSELRGVHFGTTMGALLTLFLAGFFVAEVLLPQRLQPISRRERAEITWRLHLLLDLGLLCLLALSLFVASALLALLVGFEGGASAMPDWLRAILVVAFLAPLGRSLQHTRRGQPGGTRHPALQSAQLVGWVLMVLIAQGLSILWSRHTELLPAAAWAALVLGLLVAAQLHLRVHLRRWFARCDLA